MARSWKPPSLIRTAFGSCSKVATVSTTHNGKMQTQRKAKCGITVKKPQSLGTITYAGWSNIGELIKLMDYQRKVGLPRWDNGKESACQCRLISELGRSPGEGNGNPLQYSCLENSMNRGVWRAMVHGITKELDMTEHAHMHQRKIVPASLLHSWASAAKSLQSCLTLCNPTDCSPPGSPVPGILQARILEWVAIWAGPLR